MTPPRPGLGTPLFVPKDVHATVTTICSLKAQASSGSSATASPRVNAGTRVTHRSLHSHSPSPREICLAFHLRP